MDHKYRSSISSPIGGRTLPQTSRSPLRPVLSSNQRDLSKTKPNIQLLTTPSPLSSALKLLKSRKTTEKTTISQASKVAPAMKKSILSPRASPQRPAVLCHSPNQSLLTSRLQEKSLRLYESLKSPKRSPTHRTMGQRMIEDSRDDSSCSRLPANITIKLGNPLNPLDDECDVVKIINEDGGSQCSSSHISRHSSPHSGSTINKSLNAYLAAMSPSPSRLKLKTQGSAFSSSAMSQQSKAYSPTASPYTIEYALRDIHNQNKRIQGFMYINKYFSPDAFRYRGEFPSKDIFVKVVKSLLEALGGSSNQISRLAMDTILGLLANYHLILESLLPKIFIKVSVSVIVIVFQVLELMQKQSVSA